MDLHHLDGGLRNLQMRVSGKRSRRGFVPVGLDDRVQHDVVLGVGDALAGDPFGLAHSRADVRENPGMIAHPFFPISLHLLLRSLPFLRIGLLPLGNDRRWREIGHKEFLHRLGLPRFAVGKRWNDRTARSWPRPEHTSFRRIILPEIWRPEPDGGARARMAFRIAIAGKRFAIKPTAKQCELATRMPARHLHSRDGLRHYPKARAACARPSMPLLGSPGGKRK